MFSSWNVIRQPSLVALFLTIASSAIAQQPQPASEPVDLGTVEGTTTQSAPPPAAAITQAPAAVPASAPVIAPPTPHTPVPKGPPPARIGAQAAVRLGLLIPFGKYADGVSASYISGPLLRFGLDVGYKLNPYLLLGGYMRQGAGLAGSALDEACDTRGKSCVASMLGFGALVQYQFLPAARWNPWASYGLGIGLRTSTSGFLAGDYQTSGLSFDFATLSAGVDLRLHRIIGFGLFAELGLGTYLSTLQVVEKESEADAIKHKALHYDLNFGARVIFTP